MTSSDAKPPRNTLRARKYQVKNARGQAAYKARMREAGYKQIAIWIREDVREAGRLAGELSVSPIPDSATSDPLGWMVGFAEGVRLRGKKTAKPNGEDTGS
ncbi:hypothetical protein F6685_22710 [Salmonella enterica]|nr:hypothetical protein [Salmonella enterica]